MVEEDDTHITVDSVWLKLLYTAILGLTGMLIALVVFGIAEITANIIDNLLK